MKKILAIIRPFKVEDVKTALVELGVDGMTTMDVKGFGRQRGHVEMYRGNEYTIDFVPKVMVLVVVADSLAEKAVETIAKAARTKKIGDGQIYVSALEEVVRIRTAEHVE